MRVEAKLVKMCKVYMRTRVFIENGNFCKNPRTQKSCVTWLPPNQLIILLSQRGSWIPMQVNERSVLMVDTPHTCVFAKKSFRTYML